MQCQYCQSERIVLIWGEYVCTNCGTVLGYEMLPPISKNSPLVKRERKIILELKRETPRSVKKKYSELVLTYIRQISEKLGNLELENDAIALFYRLSRRIWRGKNPRVVAASLVYIAAERKQLYIHKNNVAEIVNVSKFTVRDTVSKLRKHVSIV